MESLGDKLREAREEKGLTLEQVFRDTNISKTFITAIEKEDFTKFPGETYIIGFIRNYSEYLGFNGEECVQLYRNLMVQGQPLPLDELIKPSFSISPKVIKIAAIAFAVLAVLAVAIIVPLSLPKKDPKNLIVATASKQEFKAFEFNSEKEVFDLSSKDRVNFTEVVSGTDYSIIVESVEYGKSKIKVKVVQGDGTSQPAVEIANSTNKIFDLNSDGTRDLKLTVNSISKGGVAAVEFNRAFLDGSNFVLKDPLFNDAFLSNRKFNDAEAIIASAKTTSAFDLILSGENTSSIRYRQDAGELVVLDGIKKSQNNATLTFKVKNGILFWIANKNNLSLSVNGKAVKLPTQSGASAAFFISWKASASGNYDLVIYPLDAVTTAE